MNIKRAPYSFFTYPSIEPSAYNSRKAHYNSNSKLQRLYSLRLYILVKATPLASLSIQLLVSSRHFSVLDFQNEYICCCTDTAQRIYLLLSVKGLSTYCVGCANNQNTFWPCVLVKVSNACVNQSDLVSYQIKLHPATVYIKDTCQNYLRTFLIQAKTILQHFLQLCYLSW